MAGKKLAIARHPHCGKQFGSTPLERLSRAKVAIGAGSPLQNLAREFFRCCENRIQLKIFKERQIDQSRLMSRENLRGKN
ncbi:MAG: hypothetical protein IOB85_14720 [Methylobacterium sp.]|nr:hypothetical protein [Rhodobacter sp.]MCA3669809.1 hypothetical protein [Methylobacterium sp.]MCA3672397.1 hypothetical protein [Methylobacterium sp.]MCA3679167.1 hypothetical protein [Methylobacterium sp.]MCA3682188.1 hypothetical protein [Methylobacterium sp.]